MGTVLNFLVRLSHCLLSIKRKKENCPHFSEKQDRPLFEIRGEIKIRRLFPFLPSQFVLPDSHYNKYSTNKAQEVYNAVQDGLSYSELINSVLGVKGNIK